MLLLVPLLLVPGCLEAAECGVPGLPPGSRLVTSRGGEAVYRCREGWVGAAATRTCTEEGVWSRHTIHCAENLAAHQPSLQSGTHGAQHPHLAVDGDAATCSRTPASASQRWWQVQVRSSLVSRVLVLLPPSGPASNTSSSASVSVFVIELVAATHGRAEYKRCEAAPDPQQPDYAEFECGGERGEFVYIRDDRVTEEPLGICEVIVIPEPSPLSCGVPDSPVHGAVILSDDGSRAVFSCARGFTLVGVAEWTCGAGQWAGGGAPPVCVEMNCSVPASPANGRVQAAAGSEARAAEFRYGATVFVRCEEGFVLSGNNTRQCVEGGLWTGPPPSCSPILCQDPAAVVNGLVELVNGSTHWKAVASYQCLPGFYNYGYENTSVVYSSCQLNGTWTSVTLTCMAGPGYPPAGDIPRRENREVNPSTVITISILTVIILLIIVAIIVTVLVKRSRATIENERKTSTSSTNQLLYNQISSGSDKSAENNNDYDYAKWRLTPEKDYAVLRQGSAANEPNYLDEHIYSSLKKQGSGDNYSDRRNSIENDDEDSVYATVNFSRNSISVISDPKFTESDPSQKSDSNDVNDLYAKIDVNKKRNRK